jgi:hypothetical protein
MGTSGDNRCTLGLGRRNHLVVVLGLAWGHLNLVGSGLLWSLAPAGSSAPAGWLVMARWTLGLPLSLTTALTSLGHGMREWAGPAQTPAWALPLPALIGCALAWGVTNLCSSTTRLRVIARGACVAFCFVAFLAALGSARAFDRERVAEGLFLDAMATNAQPWLVPSSRAAARTLIRQYPRTQWASEAWRIIALDAEVSGRRDLAQAAWCEFRDCFADDAPGHALGSLRVAQFAEESLTPQAAYQHYLEARRSMAHAGPGVQGWMNADVTGGLARIAWDEGLYATAAYWARESTQSAQTAHESTEG